MMDLMWASILLATYIAIGWCAYTAGQHAGQYDRGAQMYRLLHDALDLGTHSSEHPPAWLAGIVDFNDEIRRLAKERRL